MKRTNTNRQPHLPSAKDTQCRLTLFKYAADRLRKMDEKVLAAKVEDVAGMVREKLRQRSPSSKGGKKASGSKAEKSNPTAADKLFSTLLERAEFRRHCVWPELFLGVAREQAHNSLGLACLGLSFLVTADGLSEDDACFLLALLFAEKMQNYIRVLLPSEPQMVGIKPAGITNPALAAKLAMHGGFHDIFTDIHIALGADGDNWARFQLELSHPNRIRNESRLFLVTDCLEQHDVLQAARCLRVFGLPSCDSAVLDCGEECLRDVAVGIFQPQDRTRDYVLGNGLLAFAITGKNPGVDAPDLVREVIVHLLNRPDFRSCEHGFKLVEHFKTLMRREDWLRIFQMRLPTVKEHGIDAVTLRVVAKLGSIHAARRLLAVGRFRDHIGSLANEGLAQVAILSNSKTRQVAIQQLIRDQRGQLEPYFELALLAGQRDAASTTLFELFERGAHGRLPEFLRRMNTSPNRFIKAVPELTLERFGQHCDDITRGGPNSPLLSVLVP